MECFIMRNQRFSTLMSLKLFCAQNIIWLCNEYLERRQCSQSLLHLHFANGNLLVWPLFYNSYRLQLCCLLPEVSAFEKLPPKLTEFISFEIYMISDQQLWVAQSNIKYRKVAIFWPHETRCHGIMILYVYLTCNNYLL